MLDFIKSLKSTPGTFTSTRAQPNKVNRPRLDILEDRLVPSSFVWQTPWEVTFNPGETTKAIAFEVKGDSKKEANETFSLDLFGNSSNSLFTRDRGLGTIRNDD